MAGTGEAPDPHERTAEDDLRDLGDEVEHDGVEPYRCPGNARRE
jgi:hypothetical protein